MVIQVNASSFQKEVLDYTGIVLVDFYATWCGPCKMTAPIIEQLAVEQKDVKFVKIDVDQNQELAASYSVFSIPTFVFIKDKKVVGQLVGAMGKEKFIEEIEKVKKTTS